ncbi:MAG: ABC transporter ATP-binding protein [Bacilli bacterium]
MEKIILKAEKITKTFAIGDTRVNALNHISFDIKEGEFTIILGPSGAGKTTLLNLIGGMDSITSGDLFVNGINLRLLSKKQLTDYRRNDVGFVFQFYNLMPNLTAKENVELAVELCKDAFKPEEILQKVGLSERMNNFPARLSGGEQQRVSIARALAKNPSILLCDEPTGALDYKTGKSILRTLFDMSRTDHKTVIIVTHNSALNDMADKVIYIKNGKAEKTVVNSSPKPIEEIDW